MYYKVTYRGNKVYTVCYMQPLNQMTFFFYYLLYCEFVMFLEVENAGGVRHYGVIQVVTTDDNSEKENR